MNIIKELFKMFFYQYFEIIYWTVDAKENKFSIVRAINAWGAYNTANNSIEKFKKEENKDWVIHSMKRI